MTNARFRRACQGEIQPGACLWAPADIFGVPADDDRVNGGLLLVRVVAQDIKGGWGVRCRPPALHDVRLIQERHLWVQLGAKGNAAQPTEVQESPDKPPTQLVYTQGIDGAQLGRVGSAPAAVLCRPGTLDADSNWFMLTCKGCPLETDNSPPGVCLMGPLHHGVADQAECVRCPDYHGHIKHTGITPTYSVGCRRTREA